MELSLNEVLFNIGTHEFTLGHIVFSVGAVLFSVLLYRLLVRRLIRSYFKRMKSQPGREESVNRDVIILFVLLAILGVVWSAQLDYELLSTDWITIRVTTVLYGLMVFQFARLFSWILIKFVIFQYYHIRNKEIPTPTELKKISLFPSQTIQQIAYLVAGILLLRAFQIDYTLFSFQRGDVEMDFHISSIFKAFLILLFARLIIWVLTQLLLHSYYKRKGVNIGAQYAFNQLMSYVLYVAAVLMAMESLGIKMTVIWGGAAALLVGIGLGLQQTFNDFFSGIILLFERSVEVGDVLDVEGMVGKVRRIGLRTSLVETRDNLTVVVPNSKLITEKVINWSHFDNKARFKVVVGVAYGSDTQLVKQLLLQAAEEHEKVLKSPPSFVRFISFGDSSLDFELHFYSRDLMPIEDTLSDLHFRIDQLFRENGVTIPFPQRDVWMKK
jgi:small-conductance mechanosensitive channel